MRSKIKVHNRVWLNFRLLTLLAYLLFNQTAFAAEVIKLNNLTIQSDAQNKVQILLEFTGPAVTPKSFSVEVPPTIVFDFPNVQNQFSQDISKQILPGGLIKNINIAEGDSKTRLSIDVQHLDTFNTEVSGNVLKVTFDDSVAESGNVLPAITSGKNYQVKSFDFRRGEQGEGQLIIDLSSSKISVDMKEDGGLLTVFFLGATAPESLTKQFDVTDFGTPVQTVTISNKGNTVNMAVNATGEYDKIAYQMDNQFILDVRAVSAEDQTGLNGEQKYVGEKISLNFQDISIRAVLQIIADFSGFNIITDDTVKGSITLRLQNIPWDQALDIILRSKGLSKRQQGNVLIVGPAEQIAAREKVELEGQRQAEDLGPVKSELFQINYADATTLSTLIKDKSSSLLTSRGAITVDKRTNTLLIQDVANRLNDIRELLKKLDIPVRQVEISTQIITADNTLEKALGVRLGGGANAGIGHRRLGVGSSIERGRAISDYTDGSGKSVVPPSNITTTGGTAPNSNITQQAYTTAATAPTVNNTEGLFSDLGVTGAGTAFGAAGYTAGKVGFALAKLPNGTLLDLELDALQYESKSKTIAKPKVITQDQNKATVEKGIDVPYLESTSSGAASVAFKSASLKLEVTPHITPDDKINLDLNISNDSVGTSSGTAGPQINTNHVQTKVLVDNGETVVLGGVLSIIDNKSIVKVPFFGDLPIIGGLFRNRYFKYEPTELIVFITPRIVNPIVTNQ